jgi:putative transposase
MRYRFIEQHKHEFSVVKMCKVLQVSKGGYYKWTHKKPTKQQLRNTMLTTAIKQIHEQSKRRYGSPRIAKELNMRGLKASEVLVAKLMRANEIRSIIRKKYVVTTDSKHKYPVVDNKLNRQFEVQKQNEVWVSDLTYVGTREGWVYLTTVIDLWDRKVIGWALSHTMRAKETSVAAFKMALQNRPIKTSQPHLFHSDRGIQYACEEFTNEINKYQNMERSMSRKGNCWDNAVAESFFKSLKTELIYHQKYQTKQQAELAIFEYIETFYNSTRRHQHLNNLTILEFQQLFNNNNLKNVA